MNGPISTHLRTNVAGYLALFFAIGGGTAFALDGSNTVFTDDITNGEVRSADIASNAVRSADIENGGVRTQDIATDGVRAGDIGAGAVHTVDIDAGAVRSADVLDGALTGADIDESALFNDNTLTGGDIDESSLQGVNDGRLKSSGVVTVNDEPGGSFTQVPLLSAGSYTLAGRCSNEADGGSTFPNDLAEVVIGSSSGPWSFKANLDTGHSLPDWPASRLLHRLALSTGTGAPFNVPKIDAGDYMAVAPAGLLAGEVSAGLNLMGADCAFAVTGMTG